MKPLLESIRWLAIGMSLNHGGFARRLADEVGPRAFAGASDDAYGSIEAMLGATARWEACLYEALQITPKAGETISDAVIRVLAEEASAQWEMFNSPYDERLALALTREIAQKSAKLESLVRRMRT